MRQFFVNANPVHFFEGDIVWNLDEPDAASTCYTWPEMNTPRKLRNRKCKWYMQSSNHQEKKDHLSVLKVKITYLRLMIIFQGTF